MRVTVSHALGGYAAVMTLAAAWLGLTATASPAPAGTFTTIDVQRINVREPDGTLRMTISNHASMPGMIYGKKEYPHPNRPEAGMIFYNDEGMENGGLVFDGGMKDGKRTNGGQLSFDRYMQDQTLQLVSSEDGKDRKVGIAITDRPEETMDIPAILGLRDKKPGPDIDAAAKKAGIGRAQRAWLGRATDGSVALILGDPQGRPRMKLGVADDGTPSIDLLDASGKVTKSVR